MNRPTGTVTFLFTDIEGSTRRWEDDADAMRVALAAHDDVLRAAIENGGGWMFKHTGDGVCAAFASARAAVDAAVAAQRLLELPVRMGIATGEVEQRGEDYFGPALNRAARVMAVGHGGQVLVSNATAALAAGVDLLDLGEHRLRDLSRVEHLFEVRAEGLATRFPPLRSIDAVPGNLPMQTTSFVGRDQEVRGLIELVRAHRLVTLTGVGGVGKTRLAIQVAAELVPEFPDGIWLVELAPIGDPAALPDAVATALGITTHVGITVTASVASALAGRQLLIVLDNCEHVIAAAADLVESILARTSTVKVVATSREGLRVGGERLWPVPSLDVRAGVTSAAVELFVERARAVKPGFETEVAAVTEICDRLDGIPLAIELAAARMVSMSPTDVRDRLGNRFRLLSGSRRGLERHQTLRHAVQWSYDLLNDDERVVLQHASVFVDGFNLAAITHLCELFDEYTMLELIDSLVRKSLVTTQHSGGHYSRYGLLETIRQFAEEQFAAANETISSVRDRHAHYYAADAVAHWDIWDGPHQRVATDWVDVEFANLRAGFRWAFDRHDLDTATAIAAHTTMLAANLLRFEPVGWANELLTAVGIADIRQFPRVCAAAAYCTFTGSPATGVVHAEKALASESDLRFQPFEAGLSTFLEAAGHIYSGRIDRWLEVWTALEASSGLAICMRLCGLTWGLPVVGRGAEAVALADKTLASARVHANPWLTAFALHSCGRALATTDPVRAQEAYSEGLAVSREHRIPFWEAAIAEDAAGLEADQGDQDQSLALFDVAIDSFQQAGAIGDLAGALANLAIYLDRSDRAEVAATLIGTTTGHPSVIMAVGLANSVEHLRTALGTAQFEEHAATGAAMELANAARYARVQIQLLRSELAGST